MTRRTLISNGIGMAAAAAALNRTAWAAPPKSAMGLATTSFDVARPRDPIPYLERCHDLGAAGVQMQLPSDSAALRQIRAKAEQLGMYVEAMAAFPKSNDTSAFEQALKSAHEAGAVAVRTGTTGGRRYEKWN